MIGSHDSEVVRVVAAQISPFVALYGLYVVAHGHYGPGGGFVGGAIVAVAAILLCLTTREKVVARMLPRRLGPVASGLGALLYLAVGSVPMLSGGAFLDHGLVGHSFLAPVRSRYLMIMAIEIAVGLAVFGSMLTIFDQLTDRHRSVAPADGSSPTTTAR